MTNSERHQVRPWLRVVSGVIGFVVAGVAAIPLLMGFPPVGQLHADDLFALAVLAPFLGAGLLFLVVGIVGHTPSWLPVHKPATGREFLFAMLWLLAAIALGEASRALDGWLRTHLGTGRGVSWFLSVLPSAIVFAVFLHYVDRRKKSGAESTPPAT